MTGARLTIKEMYVYPVKSLAGIEVFEWPALATGFKLDRQFMLINEKGMFVTQRQLPEMALIQPAIDNDYLTLKSREHGSITLSLETENKVKETIPARIWKDNCDTYEPDPEVSRWLSDTLKRNVRLVALSNQRTQSSPERFGEHTTTLFADAAPFLITNHSSLLSLNNTLQHKGLPKVDIRRFRPNIVIEGDLAAFEEHNHVKLTGKNYVFNLIDHCQRCVITTIDPDSGVKHPKLEPFKTVAYINPMPNNANSPAFGVNACISSNGLDETMLRIGDELIVS